MGDVPRVVFIGGYGRSGSTLLDRTLGQIEGFCSVGEIRHMWKEGLMENRLCGCGSTFHACSFWREVGDAAFGGLDNLDVESVLRVKDRVDQPGRIPQLASSRGSMGFRRALDSYRDLLSRLYSAIARCSESDVIVDSSKDVSHGYVLAGLQKVEVSVVHLIRDSRGCAFSWQRQRYNPGSGQNMNRWGALRTSIEWDAINALTAGLRWRVDDYMVARYEDLVADPKRVCASVLSMLGEDDRSIPLSGEGNLHLSVDHTVAGNPIRFKRGTIAICADDEWRSAMSAPRQAVVAGLTFPFLARLGGPVPYR